MKPRLVLVDNYDSFAWNLVQYLGELGSDVWVFRNDAIDVAGIRKLRPRGLVRWDYGLGGGGLANSSGNPIVPSNVFQYNSTSGNGGGLINGAGNPIVQNNVIRKNSATNGGGLYNDSGNPIIWNNTLASNWGNLYNETGSPDIRSNIIVSSTGDCSEGCYGGEGIYSAGGTPTVDYNGIWNNLFDYAGVVPGPNDISADPLFVSADDFHLQLDSPAIDTGDPSGRTCACRSPARRGRPTPAGRGTPSSCSSRPSGGGTSASSGRAAAGSPTPFLDALARRPDAAAWDRAMSFGSPTINAFVAVHALVPPHSERHIVTEFTWVSLLALPEALRRRGWRTAYFTATDPDWDNQRFWTRRWYDETRYWRDAESDDRLAFARARERIRELGASGGPFLATVVRSATTSRIAQEILFGGPTATTRRRTR